MDLAIAHYLKGCFGQRFNTHKPLCGNHWLYNFASARPAGLKAQTIIVAEGYMDVIALVRAGFEAAVAPLGTALTEDHLHLLWRVAPEPVMAFDGDEAGRTGMRTAAGKLISKTFIRAVKLPDGTEPDDLSAEQLATLLT